MPKRVIDGEAMWASSKLGKCAEWLIPEYAWLYPLADCNGSFELTNLRAIHGRVASVRPHFSLDDLRKVFAEFWHAGLLFTWEQDGKKYGHWTNSEKAGRLPPQAWRARLGSAAPPVPRTLLEEYLRKKTIKQADPQLQLGESSGGAPDKGLGLDLDRDLDRDLEKKVAQAETGPSPCAFRGTHLEITAKQDFLLREGFPWVDRQNEYRRMDSWLEANTGRRPKKFSRFAHNWFSRIPCSEQERNPREKESYVNIGSGPRGGTVKATALARIETRLRTLRRPEGPRRPEDSAAVGRSGGRKVGSTD